MACGERLMMMRSCACRLAKVCMSKLTVMSRPRTISTWISLESGNTMGRFDSACGAIGTSTMPPRVGCSSGPPADSA
eukprot:gene34728-42835_t